MAKDELVREAQSGGEHKPVPPRYGKTPALLERAWADQSSRPSRLTDMEAAKKKVR